MAVNAQGQFIETDNLKRSSAGFPEMDGLAAYVASLRTSQEAGSGGGYSPGLGAQGIVNVPQEQYPAAEPNLIPTNSTPDPIEEVEKVDDIAELFSEEEKPKGIIGGITDAFTTDDKDKERRLNRRQDEISKINNKFNELKKEYAATGGPAEGFVNWAGDKWDITSFNSDIFNDSVNNSVQNKSTNYRDSGKSAFKDIMKRTNNGEDLSYYADLMRAKVGDFNEARGADSPVVNLTMAEKAKLKDSTTNITGKNNPYYSLKGISNPKADKKGIYHGLNAPAQYKKDHPNVKLTKGQEILAAMEGYSGKKGYDDGTGVMTYGIGQTKDNKDMTFPEVYKIKENVVRKNIPGYNQMPDYMQTALVAAQYRGDLIGDGKNGSPATVAHLKRHNYEAAAREFLNNENYREAVKNKSGVKARFDWIVAQFKKYADSLKE